MFVIWDLFDKGGLKATSFIFSMHLIYDISQPSMQTRNAKLDDFTSRPLNDSRSLIRHALKLYFFNHLLLLLSPGLFRSEAQNRFSHCRARIPDWILFAKICAGSLKQRVWFCLLQCSRGRSVSPLLIQHIVHPDGRLAHYQRSQKSLSRKNNEHDSGSHRIR